MTKTHLWIIVFQPLVWTVENDVKTLVWTQSFLSVFGEPKTEVFKNALVWTGPKGFLCNRTCYIQSLPHICHSYTNLDHLTLHLILKMTTAQVVQTSVTTNNLSKNYLRPDDHAKQITDTPGFKPFPIEPLIMTPFYYVPRSKYMATELVR